MNIINTVSQTSSIFQMMLVEVIEIVVRVVGLGRMHHRLGHGRPVEAGVLLGIVGQQPDP